MANQVIDKERINEEVKRAVADIIGMDESEICDEMSLLGDLGIDSLDLVDLLTSVGKTFRVGISVEYWTEKIHAESLRIGEIGADATLSSISELTGLKFNEDDVEHLNEVLEGSYQTWDVVRNILSFIRVESLVNYVSTKVSEEN
ncbi:MAG: phosphopantetheine-binding protein [Clostridia bacterium]|nr:phosphopantetheine-binding protein [Clostridia bacterium]